MAKESNKRFWVILGIVFLLSGITIGISFFNSSALTGNLAIQFISSAEEGKNLFLEVRNVKGMQFMDIAVKNDLKNAKITIEEINTPPWFEGTAYSSFKIASEDANKLGMITYTLKLGEGILGEIGLKSNEVQLYYEGTALPSQYQKSEKGYSYYTASVQGLGKFVIGKREESTESAKITSVVKAQPDQVEKANTENKLPLAGKAYPSDSDEKNNFFSKLGKFFKDFLGTS